MIGVSVLLQGYGANIEAVATQGYGVAQWVGDPPARPGGSGHVRLPAGRGTSLGARGSGRSEAPHASGRTASPLASGKTTAPSGSGSEW